MCVSTFLESLQDWVFISSSNSLFLNSIWKTPQDECFWDDCNRWRIIDLRTKIEYIMNLFHFVVIRFQVTIFWPIFSFYAPWKHHKTSIKFSGAFREYKMGTLVINGSITVNIINLPTPSWCYLFENTLIIFS